MSAVSSSASPAWSAEDEARLIAASRAGLSYPVIAEQIGRSVCAVAGRLKLLRSAGQALPAKLTGGTVRAWTDAENEVVIKALADGRGQHLVARELGRSDKSIKARFNLLRTKQNADPRHVETIRNCRCCGKKFKSTWCMNRLCAHCGSKS
ncbi:hypothetical protein [Propionivibrio sp.]|uniref:hypothetical protein n=1 Tax=Propionivibrio sp. TaxID=2212460 RepID=UPI003BF0A3F0